MFTPIRTLISKRGPKGHWRHSLLFAAATAMVLIASSASAQDIDPTPSGGVQQTGDHHGWDATIGAGAIWAPKFEGAKESQATPFPYLSIHYNDLFYVEGDTIGVDLVRLPLSDSIKFTLGPVARYRRDRPESRDKVLKGLGDVGTSIETGAAAKLAVGPAWIKVIGGKDIAGGHEGTVVQGEIGASFPLLPKLRLSASGTTSWADRRYMSAYFGVTPKQSAASGLPTFRAQEGIKDVGATVSLNYQLSRRWSIAAVGGYNRLINDAKDNPLVRLRGSPDQIQGGAFLAFSF